MENKKYVKPEIEIVEISKADVLDVSFQPSWGGVEGGDFSLDWLNEG